MQRMEIKFIGEPEPTDCGTFKFWAVTKKDKIIRNITEERLQNDFGRAGEPPRLEDFNDNIEAIHKLAEVKIQQNEFEKEDSGKKRILLSTRT